MCTFDGAGSAKTFTDLVSFGFTLRLVATAVDNGGMLGARRQRAFPKPMMASVLPTMDTPTYLLRSQRPALTDASAWATLRDSAAISAMPCSAAATVLAVGAFTTRHPYCPAACTHQLRHALLLTAARLPCALKVPA